jgi:molybdopterin-guanine dinucleotide biosynthesis protein A
MHCDKPQDSQAIDSADVSLDSSPAASKSVGPVLGVVLAGGKSSRMGCDKATMMHASGVTFIDYAISRLISLVPRVVVSGRPAEAGTVDSISDQTPGLGPAVAVWSAIQFAKQQGYASILVTPIDTPNLESRHLQQLMDSVVPDIPLCATYDGCVPHPLIAIYPVSLDHELEVVALSTRRSLRAWLASRPHSLVRLPVFAMRDFNTPD